MKGSPTKFFGTVRKSIFDKLVIHHLMQFFNPEFFWDKRVLLGIFSVLWDKKFSREIRDIPPPIHKKFRQKKFLKNKWFPYETFRWCEKIKFRQNCDTPSHANFLIQKFFETQDSSYEIIRYCETKKFRENVVISHFYPQKVFDRRIFLKNEGFSYEKFRYCWENQFSTKSWYTILCTFFNPEIFWNKRVPLRIISVLWDEKISREKCDLPFLATNFFD